MRKSFLTVFCVFVCSALVSHCATPTWDGFCTWAKGFGLSTNRADTTPKGPFGDYDKDGLSNWQEYMANQLYSKSLVPTNAMSTANVYDMYQTYNSKTLRNLLTDRDRIDDWFERLFPETLSTVANDDFTFFDDTGCWASDYCRRYAYGGKEKQTEFTLYYGDMNIDAITATSSVFRFEFYQRKVDGDVYMVNKATFTPKKGNISDLSIKGTLTGFDTDVTLFANVDIGVIYCDLNGNGKLDIGSEPYHVFTQKGLNDTVNVGYYPSRLECTLMREPPFDNIIDMGEGNTNKFWVGSWLNTQGGWNPAGIITNVVSFVTVSTPYVYPDQFNMYEIYRGMLQTGVNNPDGSTYPVYDAYKLIEVLTIDCVSYPSAVERRKFSLNDYTVFSNRVVKVESDVSDYPVTTRLISPLGNTTRHRPVVKFSTGDGMYDRKVFARMALEWTGTNDTSWANVKSTGVVRMPPYDGKRGNYYMDFPKILDEGGYKWRVKLYDPQHLDLTNVVSNTTSTNSPPIVTDIGTFIVKDELDANGGFAQKITAKLHYVGTHTSSRLYLHLYDSDDFSADPVWTFSATTSSLTGISNMAVTGGYSKDTPVLPVGTYFVMAFIDVDNDGKLSPGDPYGVYDNIGTRSKFLYTPLGAEITETTGTLVTHVFLDDVD